MAISESTAHNAAASWGALALELLSGKKQADNGLLRSALAIHHSASKLSTRPDESQLAQEPILDQAKPQTDPKLRITRRHESINHTQIAPTMSNFFSALLFIAITAYYIYSMDIRHAAIILYLLVANLTEPYRTITVYLDLDCFTHTCWMSTMLCWLFDQYDVDMATLLVLLCWELAVFQLTGHLGQGPANYDVVYFGLLPILFTLYDVLGGLIVCWSE
jgi:hypothetical protein